MKEAREEAKKTETKSAVGRGDLTCKGFEVGVCLEFLWKTKQTNLPKWVNEPSKGMSSEKYEGSECVSGFALTVNGFGKR